MSERRFPQIAQRKKRAILSALAVTGTITRAAKAAKVSRRSHALWMKEDAAYAAAYAEAIDEACDALELEARRRAIKGVRRPVLYQGKQVMIQNRKTGVMEPLWESTYSDNLLMFLLKGNRPEKFGELMMMSRIVRLEERVENNNGVARLNHG